MTNKKEHEQEALLKKPISQLTPEDLKTLRRVLGTQGLPYPAYDAVTREDNRGNKYMITALSKMQDPMDEFYTLSDRPYAEVYGASIREMPSPSMLPIFSDALMKARPESKRRVVMVKGDPGAGKSFMGKLMGKMGSPEGAVVVDCGGMNLADLMYETVLDMNADRSFYKEMDKRLAEGGLSEASLNDLEELFGDSQSTDLNDADYKEQEKANSSALIKESGKIVGINWKKVKGDKAGKVLESIGRLEGILDNGGNALGMISQEGPLLQALRNGTYIVLDEYNKSKPTDDSLQEVLQFLAGEIDEFTYENPIKEKGKTVNQRVHFTRNEMKAGFFAFVTGNAVEDGITTRQLNKSVNSRLSPVTLPKATEQDWEHRLCQIFTGMPISTLYNIEPGQWDENPEAFAKYLVTCRQLGLSAEQKKNIPEQQLTMLRNWKDTMQGIQQLARFYYFWSQITDMESDLLQHTDYSTVAMEIDEEFTGDLAVDFRKIILHEEEANLIAPKIVSADEPGGFDLDIDLEVGPAPNETIPNDARYDFGSRYVNAILKHVHRTSSDLGKKGLAHALQEKAKECGLLETDLQEGQASNMKLVADLLDMNPFTSDDRTTQIEVMQGVIVEYLRQLDKNLKDAEPNEIINKAMLEMALDMIEEDDMDAEISSPIHLIKKNIEDLDAGAFSEAHAVDAANVEEEDTVAAVDPKQLVSEEDFLQSLMLPVIGSRNLDLLNAESLSKLSDASSELPCFKIAEGRHESGIDIHSVVVRRDNVDSVLHILRNEQRGKMMIVGGEIQEHLKRGFERRGIRYINRLDRLSSQKADAAITDVVGGQNDSLLKSIRQAFLLRNKPAETNGLRDRASLGKLMTSLDTQAVLPTYLAQHTSKSGSGKNRRSPKRATNTLRKDS